MLDLIFWSVCLAYLYFAWSIRREQKAAVKAMERRHDELERL